MNSSYRVQDVHARAHTRRHMLHTYIHTYVRSLCNNLFTYADYESCAKSGVLDSTKLISRGLYAYQLERWLSFFRREQMMIMRRLEDCFVVLHSACADLLSHPPHRSEDFFSDLSGTVHDVLRFVGKNPTKFRFPSNVSTHVYNPNPKVTSDQSSDADGCESFILFTTGATHVRAFVAS
eukprot:TRINITY_DN4497_c0_g1_i3.p1 TRINITY_DN4497_c0_g1~~TRINITY_DN4497_c0_g1_i3.p1  ORF type:complete len:179 (+),score=8.50 TRINITY_DN4497_c0_g1_i3:3-539(+)